MMLNEADEEYNRAFGLSGSGTKTIGGPPRPSSNTKSLNNSRQSLRASSRNSAN